jgi:hypothetical protein
MPGGNAIAVRTWLFFGGGVAAIAYFALVGGSHPVASDAMSAAETASQDSIDAAIATRAHGLEVESSGKVVRLLFDDTEGSRHQRFIVRLRSGASLLIAHNIDLAPRIAPLAEGDTVSFRGDYEWNPRGGVVHWTHRDPNGRHEAGWIRHDGQTFQ